MEEHNETTKPTKPPDRRNHLREPIIVWTRRYKQGSKLEPGYGIRFLNLPEDIALAIDNWIVKETLEMFNDG